MVYIQMLFVNKCWSHVKYQARNSRGGRGERGGPLIFFENWKKCPNPEKKNALIVVIYGKIPHLKWIFSEFLDEKNRDFFPAGLFFLIL